MVKRDNEQPWGSPSSFFEQYKTLIIAGLVAVIAILGIGGGLTTYIIKQQVIKHGLEHEADMSGAYEELFSAMTACTSKVKLTGSAVKANAKAFQETVRQVAMREGQFASIDPTTQAGRLQLATVLTQTWPDIKGGQSDLFRDFMRTVTDCIDANRSAQTPVNQEVKEFRKWKAGYWARKYGKQFPDENLEIHRPDGTLIASGKQAFARISTSIGSSETNVTRETGENNIPDPLAPDSDTATATP